MNGRKGRNPGVRSAAEDAAPRRNYVFTGREPLHAGSHGAIPAPRRGTRPRTRSEAKAQPRTPVRERQDTAESFRQSFAPLTVLGVLAAVFLLVTGITARINLVRLSEEGLALETQLKELEVQRTRLQIAYESAFNLGEVETYARDVLGMRKPTADQIQYIDTSGPDRAEVLNPVSRDGFVDRVSDLLANFREYFRFTGE